MEGWANMLYGAAVSFVVCGLLFGIGLVILANFSTTTRSNMLSSGTENYTTSSYILKANNASINATAEIPNNWLQLVAVVIAAVIIIGLVLGGLAFAVGKQR